MNVHFLDHPSDSLLLDVYWDDELLYTVYKKLFLKELKLLTPISSREAFIQAFSALEIKLAKRAMAHLLARKGYLSQEIQKKLLTKRFSTNSIEQAIAFGKKGGYLNDEQELQRQVRSEIRKGKGPQAVLFKLKQKRVSEDLLTDVKHEMVCNEKRTLQEWLSKKGIEHLPKDYRQRQKLYNQLMRRGFSSDAIFSVLKGEWSE